MTAGTYEKDVIGELMAVTRPRNDRRVLPRNPPAIIAMQINRHAAKRVAPIGDGRIKMRMRDSNRLEATERSNMFDRVVSQHGNAIPQHTAVRFPHQKRALPDRETGLDTDSRNAQIFTPDKLVTFRQLFAGEPRLAFPVHELPLVLADKARQRRLTAFGKLGTALFASPERQRSAPLSQRNIQPAERVDGYAVAGANDDRRGLRLNDSRTYDGVAWLQAVKRKNRNLAPTAEEGLPCR